MGIIRSTRSVNIKDRGHLGKVRVCSRVVVNNVGPFNRAPDSNVPGQNLVTGFCEHCGATTPRYLLRT
jgi:hypothetical protein